MYKFDTEGVKFEITRESDGTFVISGYDIEKTFKMTDFSRDESVRRFARQMRGMGIDGASCAWCKRRRYCKILEYEFEFID